jgi:diacylglycerol kinase family enzyme
VGIGASVVQRVGETRYFLGSNLTYLRAVLATFLSYRHMELHLVTDAGLEWRGKSLAMVAANGCYFGAGLCVAPGAKVDDGQLLLTVVGDAGIADFLANLARLKRGIPIDHSEVRYHSARSVTVETAGPAAPVEADGEFLGYTPTVIEVQPGAVRFLAP